MLVRSESIFVAGTGVGIPESVITNDELARNAPTSAPWIRATLGIESRRHLPANGSLARLSAIAAAEAISNARLHSADIDAVIVATSTPDEINPATAVAVHAALGLRASAPAYDLQAVCSGFLFALQQAVALIQAHAAEAVLVIGADRFSRITNFAARDCVFFGDGAGAAIVRRSTSPNAFMALETFTNPGEGFRTPWHTGHFEMNGKAVFETASRVLPDAITGLLDEMGLSIDEVTAIFPHQPSKRVLEALEEALGTRPGIVRSNLLERGNTAAASIPILLHETTIQDPLRNGDIVVYASVGAGWTWGVGVQAWSDK
jgi:3-oxoacyl-[acyl-carrier-protein] synthase-3